MHAAKTVHLKTTISLVKYRILQTHTHQHWQSDMLLTRAVKRLGKKHSTLLPSMFSSLCVPPVPFQALTKNRHQQNVLQVSSRGSCKYCQLCTVTCKGLWQTLHLAAGGCMGYCWLLRHFMDSIKVSAAGSCGYCPPARVGGKHCIWQDRLQLPGEVGGQGRLRQHVTQARIVGPWHKHKAAVRLQATAQHNTAHHTSAGPHASLTTAVWTMLYVSSTPGSCTHTHAA